MEGVTWWDSSDGGWLNAPAGLLRKDGSSKPAYDELMKLIEGEWWTAPIQRITDDKGQIQFDGFLGEYELHFEGLRESFTLAKEDMPPVIRVDS